LQILCGIILSTFFERLREERKRLGMNQTELAGIAGVQKQAQVNYESGERSPNSDYLTAIAAVGADVLYILTGSREGPVPETLTSEERVMLDYFRQASAPVRKAALGALLSSAPGGSSTSAKVNKSFFGVAIGKVARKNKE